MNITEFFVQNSEVIIRLSVAVFMGLVIGIERTLVNKEAGMKTHAMVSLGAALFVIVSEFLATKSQMLGLAGFDPSRIASQIVVGVGFLGAGAIVFQESRVLGLTTAGGLWVTAAIGMAAGYGLFGLAIIGTVLVFFIFVVVYMLEKYIKRVYSSKRE